MRRLTDDDIVRVLTENGIGVLALDGGPDAPPYPVPVAFGYDPESDCLAFHLEGGDEGEKHRRLARSNEVGFAVHGEASPGVWRSVLVSGVLTEAVYADVEPALAALARNTQSAPTPLSWADGTRARPFELRIDEWSGREFHVG